MKYQENDPFYLHWLETHFDMERFVTERKDLASEGVLRNIVYDAYNDYDYEDGQFVGRLSSILGVDKDDIRKYCLKEF